MKKIIIILILIHGSTLYGQIQNKLDSIRNEITFEIDTTITDWRKKSRGMQYTLEVVDSTLYSGFIGLNYFENVWGNGPDTFQMNYEIPIEYIDTIYLERFKDDNRIACLRITSIEKRKLFTLFKENEKTKLCCARLDISKDSLNVELLENLIKSLNSYFIPSSKPILEDCSKIKIPKSNNSSGTYLAVNSQPLLEGIRLGNEKYLSELIIKELYEIDPAIIFKFPLDVIVTVNKNNVLEFISSYSLPQSITEKLFNRLKDKNWKCALCNGKKVDAYILLEFK